MKLRLTTKQIENRHAQLITAMIVLLSIAVIGCRTQQATDNQSTATENYNLVTDYFPDKLPECKRRSNRC